MKFSEINNSNQRGSLLMTALKSKKLLFHSNEFEIHVNYSVYANRSVAYIEEGILNFYYKYTL